MEEKLGIKVRKFNNIRHTVVNFVDDSNSLVCFTNPEEANEFIETYFKILTKYYNQNKLLLKPEKTNLLIPLNPAVRNHNQEIRIETEIEAVSKTNRSEYLV